MLRTHHTTARSSVSRCSGHAAVRPLVLLPARRTHQLSISDDTGGLGLRNCMCACGSCRRSRSTQ